MTPDQAKPDAKKSLFHQILENIRSMYKDFFFSNKEMVEIFDKKYAGSGVVQLLDEKGESIADRNGKRIEPVEFEKISKDSKEAHIRGLLYTFTTNPVGLVGKLQAEPEILEFAESKGSNLKQMVEEEIRNKQNY